MSIDLILGASAALAFYGLMWYLVLKSRKIIESIDKEGPGHTGVPRNGTGSEGNQRKSDE